MSITGRNRWRGSTCHVYRAQKAERDGALTGRLWVRVATDVRLAIHATTDEIVRRFWGVESEVEAVIVLEQRGARAIDVRNDDALIVTAGEYAGQRFYVQASRSLRKVRECGLVSTTDPIDASIAGTDPDETPLASVPEPAEVA